MEKINEMNRIVFDAEKKGISVNVFGSNGNVYITAGRHIKQKSARKEMLGLEMITF